MDYSQSLNYLYGLGHEVLAAKFGLESVTLLLEALGRPDQSFRSILVAGTNGKGSVAAMIESIARQAEYRVALYTSPHLIRIEERIRTGGNEISEEEFARLATRVRVASESLLAEGKLEWMPTFFEQVTAIALLHFSDSAVDLAVLEVGLGGRLDATNAVDAIVSVVTSIDFDHQNILGNTITEIASEKAAIIKPGRRAVIGRQKHKEATEVLMRRCLEVSVLPVFANEATDSSVNDLGRMSFDYESSHTSYSRLMLGLRGRHQVENASAAIETAELLTELGIEIPREAIVTGLREITWPGRLELVEDRPPILLDGAHNVAGARSLKAYLDESWQGHITLIFGVMADKNIEGIATELFPTATTIVLTRVNDRRAASNARMGKSALASSRNVVFTESVRQALSWARSVTPLDGLILVAGSLFLVGEVKRLLAEEEDDSQRWLTNS